MKWVRKKNVNSHSCSFFRYNGYDKKKVKGKFFGLASQSLDTTSA